MAENPRPEAHSPEQQAWFRAVNPDEHCYTPGYGFSPHPPFLVERRQIFGAATSAVLCLFGFFFLGSFVPQTAYELLSRLPVADAARADWLELSEQLSLVAGVVASLVIPFAVYSAAIGIPRGCALPARPVDVRLAIAAVLCSLAVAVIGGYSSGMFDAALAALGLEFYSPELVAPYSMGARVLYWLNLTLFPAVFEELAFRGSLMQSLRRFGDGFALLTSSVLFALVHVVPMRFPNAFLMGLAIGYFVLYTGSLRIGIIIHLVHNTVVLALSEQPLPQGLSGELISLSAQAGLLVLGLAALLWLMRRSAGLFSLRPARAANPEGERLKIFFFNLPMSIFVLVVALQAAGYLM